MFKSKKKILFVIPYPHGKAPSQRFRFEQYLDLLQSENFSFTLAPFLDDKTWAILYKPGHTIAKMAGILKGFMKRLGLLFTIPAYDFIFIHREATPIGPPWFEWITAKVLRKKIIYDFDDAIWIPNTSENNKMVAGIKWHHKVSQICEWAYKISCGNEYLCDFARQYNSHVVHNPTTIDTVELHNPGIYVKPQNEIPVIGWTGTHSTLQYLLPLLPVLKRLEQKHQFQFLVISNADPDLDLKSYQFLPWRKETEIQDLNQMDVGVMPLTEDKWAKGKCGFKALQYMALGIPAVVSPVGVNTKIVDDGVNGFICSEQVEWENALSKMLSEKDLREQFGKAARNKVVEKYSVSANAKNFLSLFK